MRIAKLTLKDIARARLRPGRYGDGGGLYLVVDSETSSYWTFRYTSPVTRRERRHGLGSLSDFNAVEAREKARKCRQQLAEGIDPIEAASSERRPVVTFEAAAEAYCKDHSAKWSNAKHQKQFMATLRAYAFPKIGAMSVQNVSPGNILDILRPINLTKHETAARVRMRCEWVFDWAIVNGHRSGENPARREIIAAGLPRPARQVRHFPSLPYQQLPELMSDLKLRSGVAARALRFLILTALRTNECLGAKWSDYEEAERLLIIPPSRTKTRTELRVPLAPQAVAILKDLPRIENNPYMFVGPVNDRLSNAALSALLERMSMSEVTVHGFRASFRNFAEERTTYSDVVKELCLGHKVGTKVERAYMRSDLLASRRALMNDWADYLDGNVIRLETRVG